MSVAGFSDVVCQCGCDNLLPLRAAAHGWKYLYGHKPKGVSLGGASLRRSPKVPKPGPVHEVGFSATLAMVEENRAAIVARTAEIEEEILALRGELEQMRRQHTALWMDLEQLDALRDALAPFCPAAVRLTADGAGPGVVEEVPA